MNQDARSPSDRGCAIITGFAILENGRIVDPDKPRNYTFDAHIYAPGKSDQADEILAVVRFYTANRDVFSANWPDIGLCFIHATVRIHYIKYIFYKTIY